MMRSVTVGTALAAILVAAFAARADTDIEARSKGSLAVIKQFGGSLKAELKGAMQASGPVGAIQVCSEKAPAIAARHGEETGWDIGRTSLKYRNPNNAPDDWERAVLQSFERRKAAGEDVTKMVHAEFTEWEGRKVFRYMKAIPTDEICLNCHGGDTVKPEVAAKLAEFYPDDQARGFSVGDIRGAFTIVQPVE
jgi:hypothetical protein